MATGSPDRATNPSLSQEQVVAAALAFIDEHGLTDLFEVVNSVPPLKTDYVPRDSIVREFVGGSIFQY